MFLQVILRYDEGLIEHWNMRRLQIRNHRKALAPQSPHESAVEHGGVYSSRFQSLTDQHRISNDEQTDIVAFRIHTDMLQRQHRVHPCTAADALDAEFFASQVFRSLDTRTGDDRMSQFTGNRGQDFKISALSGRSHHRPAAGGSDFQVSRYKAGHQNRRAFDKNEPGLDALLGKESLFLGNDQRKGSRTYRRVANGNLRLGE